MISVNPDGEEVSVPLEKLAGACKTAPEMSAVGEGRILLQIGEAALADGKLTLGGQSFVVLK